MTLRILLAVGLISVPVHVAAQPVAVKVEWNGNDAAGGILINRVRGLIANSPDKREANDRQPGLAVILQTVDPAVEWKDGGAGRFHSCFGKCRTHGSVSGEGVVPSEARDLCAASITRNAA